MTNDLYSVQNDSGEPLVITLGGHADAGPGIEVPVPLYRPANAAHPVKMAFGGASFIGNNAATVYVPVMHGLGKMPSFTSVLPALASNGIWNGHPFQYQSADAYNFYVGWDNGAVPGSSPTQLWNYVAGVTYWFNWMVLVELD